MDTVKQFRAMIKKQKAYQYALTVVSWDSNTEAPREAFARRAEMMGVLSAELFKLSTGEDYQKVVYELFEHIDSLEDSLQREVRKAKKSLDKIIKIPEEEFVSYRKLVNLTQKLWEDAKEQNDYDMFKGNLDSIIKYQKKFIEYYEMDELPYNILLDEYEEGMTMEEYDHFFDVLRKDLVPFVQEVLEAKKEYKNDFTSDLFDPKKQAEFCEYITDEFAFDRNRGLMKTSVHPFTWNTHPGDVRFTTRYLEDMVLSSIFAAIHELGHATYEQQVDSKWDDTLLNSGTSMGMHESQSRFYENMIGRSRAFWETHLDAFKNVFPEQLKNVSVEDAYRAANKVEASLIRVEADELTYPLHIMVRYDLERMIFSQDIDIDDLPRLWNEKMEEYLNLTPKTDAEGILQDVHWSGGAFGYFPTYALGTAYSAQIYYTMKKELNLDEIIKNRDIHLINEWLKEKIHHYGSSKSPKELMIEVTNEEFNPAYYVRYLKEKYSDLYLNK